MTNYCMKLSGRGPPLATASDPPDGGRSGLAALAAPGSSSAIR